MQEIAPGLWHWTARHERIHAGVSSYYLLAERVLIDAMVPAEGLSWFEEHGVPEHVLLTNRHHDRYADGRLPDADMPYWPAELCPHVEYSSTLNPAHGLPLHE